MNTSIDNAQSHPPSIRRSHRHIVMFSGGVGSWAAAKLVAQRYGSDNLVLLFADTTIEDEDNYRFILEGAANIMGMQINPDWIAYYFQNPPSIAKPLWRETWLRTISGFQVHLRPQADNGLHWLSDWEQSPWSVFFSQKFLNHRVSNCSKQLKQDVCKHFVFSPLNNFDPETTTLHFGIDFNEIERLEAIRAGWQPYQCDVPLCWDQWLTREDTFTLLQAEGIKPPRLYAQGFSHANCGGFCVRAGKKHYRNLLAVNRDRYLFHEQQEQQFQQVRPGITILREQIDGEKRSLSLRELRERVETSSQQLSLFDDAANGGCGCFLD